MTLRVVHHGDSIVRDDTTGVVPQVPLCLLLPERVGRVAVQLAQVGGEVEEDFERGVVALELWRGVGRERGASPGERVERGGREGGAMDRSE